MAVTAGWFGLAHAHAFGGITAGETALPIDWLTDVIKISLHTSAYTPDKDAHDFWDDCTNECSGTGYTTGGVTLASKTLVYSAATHVLTFDAADVSWTAGASWSASKPRCAVIYKVLTDAAHSPLIGYINFGADQTVDIWNIFKIVFSFTGIFTVSPA